MSLIDPTPEPQVSEAERRARAIRSALSSASQSNLTCYREVREALKGPDELYYQVLELLGEGAEKLPAIASTIRQALALGDDSLAQEFDRITEETTYVG